MDTFGNSSALNTTVGEAENMVFTTEYNFATPEVALQALVEIEGHKQALYDLKERIQKIS